MGRKVHYVARFWADNGENSSLEYLTYAKLDFRLADSTHTRQLEAGAKLAVNRVQVGSSVQCDLNTDPCGE